MEDHILATECLVIILILISFSFYKHSRLGGIFLSGNRLLFSSQIIASNLYASNKQGELISIPLSDLAISSNGYYHQIAGISLSLFSFSNCFF